MRKALVGSLSVVVLLGLSAVPATGHVSTTSVTVAKFQKHPKRPIQRAASVVITGRVRAAEAQCRRGRKVDLMLDTPGRDRRVGRDVTDREGEFRFIRRPFFSGAYWVRVPATRQRNYAHDHRCRAGFSRFIIVIVRPRGRS